MKIKAKPAPSEDTIPRLLRRSVKQFGSELAIVDGKITYTFNDLLDGVTRYARGLTSFDVGPSDRVAIWAPNSSAWIVAALAVHEIGAVLVPINTRYKGAEAAAILARSGAKALFTVTDFLGLDYFAMLQASGVPLPDLKMTCVLRGPHPDAGAVPLHLLDGRGRKILAADAERAAMAVEHDDVSDILYTSGTTGQPKGVMATHLQTVSVFREWSSIVGLRAGDRYLAALPFFHTFGYKAGWLACLMRGATVYPQPVFDVAEVLAKIAEDKITVFPGPPTFYQSLLAHPDLDKHDLSTLRLAVTGAASIPVDLIHRMRERLAFKTVLTAYGLTEATGVCTMCRQGDDLEIIANTSGRAIPDVEVCVVDDAGKELPRGEAGEVVVRGYNVTGGYYEDEDETAKAIDKDGWLHTGDIGKMDAQGNLSITDRKKDMFIVGGFNVYPAEIEAVLLRYEGVAQAAVIGVPDERLGEVGVAFVVPRPGATLSAEGILGYCKEVMANFKAPRRVEIVEDLPLNATGKVQKFVLRERARSAGAT